MEGASAPADPDQVRAVPDPPCLADWSDLVVICGAVPWNGPRMLDQHLALGLARYGPVLYIDTPVPWRPDAHRDAAAAGRTSGREDPSSSSSHPGLALATPRVLPGHQRPG